MAKLRPDTELMFFDEGRFGLHSDVGRRWALRGVRPITPVRPRYKNFYIYSAGSPLSGAVFSLFLPWVNTCVMNIYLQKLSEEFASKRVLLIMDQAGWHRSQELCIPSNIEIDYLPPYSPELNPIERLWLVLRRNVCRNRLYDNEEDLIDKLCASLNAFTTENLKKLFRCEYLLNFN